MTHSVHEQACMTLGMLTPEQALELHNEKPTCKGITKSTSICNQQLAR